MEVRVFSPTPMTPGAPPLGVIDRLSAMCACWPVAWLSTKLLGCRHTRSKTLEGARGPPEVRGSNPRAPRCQLPAAGVVLGEPGRISRLSPFSTDTTRLGSDGAELLLIWGGGASAIHAAWAVPRGVHDGGEVLDADHPRRAEQRRTRQDQPRAGGGAASGLADRLGEPGLRGVRGAVWRTGLPRRRTAGSRGRCFREALAVSDGPSLVEVRTSPRWT